MNDEEIKGVIIYFPQAPAGEYTGPNFLGITVDGTLGLLFIRVRDNEGREISYNGLPFGIINAGASRIAPPSGLVVPR